MSLCSNESESTNPIRANQKSNKINRAVNLPSVAVYNCRSLFPKLGNIKTDILERSVHAAFCVEIWEKSENKIHRSEIEKMLEIEGLKYISTPRPTGWGGAAIIVNQRKFSIEKLNISNPKNLEIVWGLLKPKAEDAIHKKIIVCSFYSPPRSRKKQSLLDHIITTLQMLSTQYPTSPIIMGADKNDLDIRPILNCGLRLRQIVDQNTRGDKILDIIITNVPQLYKTPVIVPPVPCDDPSSGVPSDHSVPVCYPHTDPQRPPVRNYKTISYRPIPHTGIAQFGQWITAQNFSEISDTLTSDQFAQKLEDILVSKLDQYCPMKTVRLGSQDKAWVNKEIKQISRQKQREWVKNGKTEKYKHLSKKFKTKYKAAAEQFMRGKIDSLKETEPGKAFKILKDMGAQPGDCIDNHGFTLPSHQAEKLTPKQSADRIAEYFANISKEFPPLNTELLPERVKKNLLKETTPPTVSEFECYKKIKAAKKPQSGVPGDLPSKILKEFSVELASPLQRLINKTIKTAKWPTHFKREYITPIGKVPEPQSEDDLRPIALTPFFSKVMEHFVVAWLLEIIGPKIDFRQYGGTKGNSISHYLIELINFILYNQDKKDPTAVLACLVDFSKAFNKQDHNILITKLSDLGVPSWLLRLVIAFLQDRTMVVRYKGAVSDPRNLPGGGPQGTLLGLLLFIILINDLGFEDQSNNLGELITCKRKVKEFNLIHLKYVDDLTLAEAIDMKRQLTNIPETERPQPDNFHERTGHTLEPKNSKIHSQLLKTEQYARENKMEINYSKTKLMLFNPGQARDFSPRFDLSGHQIEMVEESKLLGLIIRSDLSWSSNTTYMVSRANRKLWFLRRLKALGATSEDLKDVYVKQIRCILEYAAPVWHSSVTVEDSVQIERVQKSAMRIILSDKYLSYKNALVHMQLETLYDRRERLCTKFAKKCFRNKKFHKWFKTEQKETITRQRYNKFCSVYSRTERYNKSPISYLTKLLNKTNNLK